MAYCGTCGAWNAAGNAHCTGCGAGILQAPPPAYPLPSPTQALAPGEKPIDLSIAILALVLNIAVIPGLGSLIAGDKAGWWQLGLLLAGFLLIFTIIGIIIAIPLFIGAWIWGIVTGAQLIQRANAQKAAATAQRT